MKKVLLVVRATKDGELKFSRKRFKLIENV